MAKLSIATGDAMQIYNCLGQLRHSMTISMLSFATDWRRNQFATTV